MGLEKRVRNKPLRAAAIGVGSFWCAYIGSLVYKSPDVPSLLAALFPFWYGAESIAAGIKGERYFVIARHAYSHLSRNPYVLKLASKIKRITWSRTRLAELDLSYKI